MPAELPARTLVVTLPAGVCEALAHLAEHEAEEVSEIAARMLAEVVRYGRPGVLTKAGRLAAQVADQQAATITQLRAELGRGG